MLFFFLRFWLLEVAWWPVLQSLDLSLFNLKHFGWGKVFRRCQNWFKYWLMISPLGNASWLFYRCSVERSWSFGWAISISYHHFPNSRIEMSPEDAQHLWAKEFQDCNLGHGCHDTFRWCLICRNVSHNCSFMYFHVHIPHFYIFLLAFAGCTWCHTDTIWNINQLQPQKTWKVEVLHLLLQPALHARCLGFFMIFGNRSAHARSTWRRHSRPLSMLRHGELLHAATEVCSRIASGGWTCCVANSSIKKRGTARYGQGHDGMIDVGGSFGSQ